MLMRNQGKSVMHHIQKVEYYFMQISHPFKKKRSSYMRCLNAFMIQDR